MDVSDDKTTRPLGPPALAADPVGFLTIPAVILAFSLQPLLPYADPARVLAFGLELQLLYLLFHFLKRRVDLTGWHWLSLHLALLVAWIMLIQPPQANARANASRCLAIQREMLSARPRRADGPDLFQALGCRPQGEGSVYAPPPARNGR